MGRYLVLWEMDHSRIPVDPKERASGFKPLVAMVKQDIEKGKIKEWGGFAGEGRGYEVFDGTEMELTIHLQQFVPFVDFEVHPLVSIGQIEEMILAMSS